MSGHPNHDELDMISDLEAHIDPLHGPVEDMVRLGQLYICPIHDDERALGILRIALEREPLHPWAIYWIAYIQLWDLMDRDSLLSAKATLESWLDSTLPGSFEPEARAAILQRLVQVRDSQDLADLTDAERITFLEESVRLAPCWVINRWYLARAYLAVGRVSEAEEQLNTALANMTPEGPARDIEDDLFETDVTGCISAHLPEEIRRMLHEIHQ